MKIITKNIDALIYLLFLKDFSLSIYHYAESDLTHTVPDERIIVEN